MSEKLQQFLQTPHRSPNVEKYYKDPTCPDVEKKFTMVFTYGISNKTGSIYENGNILLARLYRATVLGANEWLHKQTPSISQHPILVKNPERKFGDQDYGETNGLITLSYENNQYLFVCQINTDNTFRIVRPIRGENKKKHNYQTVLLDKFNDFTSSLSENFVPEVWNE